jgi:lipopolysaccharide/colanic/teichoic acid biosynthesis glycosyltransferase
MTNEKDEHGNLLPDKERLTVFGKLLRSTSLDELPNLINVVKGEMSIVGPRPLKMEYLGLYSKEQMRRHEVRPGITGWAQVNGRNAISFSEKFKLDVWYVDHHNIQLDTKIIFLTILKVLRRENINAMGDREVESFNGYN